MSQLKDYTVVGMESAEKPRTLALGKREGTKVLLTASPANSAFIDAEWINRLYAGRKTEREVLTLAFETIARAHGATVDRRDRPAVPGYDGQGIDLRIALKGVGANVSFSNLHGGYRALISWYNDYEPGNRTTRDFSGAFRAAVRSYSSGTGHKATTIADNWHRLAMALDGGLLVAAAGEAF